MSDVDTASRFTTSDDGLRLHFLDVVPSGGERRTPLVCLPGLTRPAEDFAPLAVALANTSATPRRVIAIDYRGRGRSDHDEDWRRYDLAVERADFLKLLGELGIARAHFIGTSRGGLHMLALAAICHEIIAGAVFNDIGPVLEPAGLARIKTYVVRSMTPKNLDDAIALLKRGAGKHFDGLSAEEWRHFAITTFGRDEADLALHYDPALANVLGAFDLEKPLPQSWHLFDKLVDAPVLTIRGANSDLLSPETLMAMERRWPASETFTVPGQGHAPLLIDAPTIGRIDAFLASADRLATAEPADTPS